MNSAKVRYSPARSP